jgi:hypothetical protein
MKKTKCFASAAGMAALLLFLTSCATTTTSSSRLPLTDILGVHLDMRPAAVQKALASIGKLDRTENKRQEVWTVHDPRFSSLLIGYDREGGVRYVTAIADPAGQPVTYADVIDIATAEHRTTGANHTYTWAGGNPKYSVIVIGNATRVEYLSLKEGVGELEGDDEDEDDD